jgi:uncharacterized protein (TIGR03085 family)
MAATVARAERLALCDLFLDVGPDAPTLCEGWTTADLAAHLAVRERNPAAGLGIVFGPLSGHHDRAIEAEKAKRDYAELVERVRSGPPLGPHRWLETQFNTIEYFVHHEDVRRGAGDHRPRDGIDDIEASLWSLMQRGGRLVGRKVGPIGLDLVAPDRDVIHVRKGGELVRLVGSPGEILLYLQGRKSAAQVELDGPLDAVRILQDAQLGV